MQPTLKLSDIVSGPNHRRCFDPQAMKELEEGLKAVPLRAVLDRPAAAARGGGESRRPSAAAPSTWTPASGSASG